jgi:hypothetical protein
MQVLSQSVQCGYQAGPCLLLRCALLQWTRSLADVITVQMSECAHLIYC